MIINNGLCLAQSTQFRIHEVEVVNAIIDLARKLPIISANFWLSIKVKKKVKYLSEEEEIALGLSYWLWDYLRRSGASGIMCQNIISAMHSDYKPITSTYKSDDSKQQTVIHYTDPLDINEQWQPISVPIHVPVPIPVPVPVPINVSMSNNPETIYNWQQIHSQSNVPNNQFVFNNNNIFPYQLSHNKYNNMYTNIETNIIKNECNKWKKARDPSSGKSYWYHKDTKETK